MNNANGVPVMLEHISTTLLRQWGFRQCLLFSWTTLRGKHCRRPIAVMGVADTFGPSLMCILIFLITNYFTHVDLVNADFPQTKERKYQGPVVIKFSFLSP